MLDRSKGNGGCFACRLLLGHETRVMLLGRFWSVFVGTSARPEPLTLHLSRPLLLSPVLVFLVECCCFEVCCTELMVMLLLDAAFGRRSRRCRPDRRRRRSASCCLPRSRSSSCSLHWSSCCCCCATKLDRYLSTETDCFFWDRSSTGVERCPPGCFSSVVPAAAVASAATIALRSNGRHRLLPHVMLCYGESSL